MLETPRYPNKSFDVMNTIFFPQSIQYPREEYTTRKLRGITYCSNFNYDTDTSSTLDSNNVLFPVYKIHIILKYAARDCGHRTIKDGEHKKCPVFFQNLNNLNPWNFMKTKLYKNQF